MLCFHIFETPQEPYLLLGFILKTNIGAYSLNYIMGWGYREKSVFARPSSVPYLLLVVQKPLKPIYFGKAGEKLHRIGGFPNRNSHLVEGGRRKRAENIPFLLHQLSIYRGTQIRYVRTRGRATTSIGTLQIISNGPGCSKQQLKHDQYRISLLMNYFTVLLIRIIYSPFQAVNLLSLFIIFDSVKYT